MLVPSLCCNHPCSHRAGQGKEKLFLLVPTLISRAGRLLGLLLWEWEPRTCSSQPWSLTWAWILLSHLPAVSLWSSNPLICYFGFLFAENLGDAEHGRSHHSHHELWRGSLATQHGTALGPTSQGGQEALKHKPRGRDTAQSSGTSLGHGDSWGLATDCSQGCAWIHPHPLLLQMSLLKSCKHTFRAQPSCWRCRNSMATLPGLLVKQAALDSGGLGFPLAGSQRGCRTPGSWHQRSWDHR